MMHMYSIPRNPAKQVGVTIVTAIFLIVVLSLMGLGMIILLTTSQQSISQEITSVKSYMAGRSCIQWGMYQAVFSPGTATGSHTTTFSDTTSGLYNSKCNTTFTTISADSLTFYKLDITASFGDVTAPEFSQRKLKLQFQP